MYLIAQVIGSDRIARGKSKGLCFINFLSVFSASVYSASTVYVKHMSVTVGFVIFCQLLTLAKQYLHSKNVQPNAI